MLLENLNEDIRSCLIRFLYSVQDQLISILIVILILLESESSDTNLSYRVGSIIILILKLILKLSVLHDLVLCLLPIKVSSPISLIELNI